MDVPLGEAANGWWQPAVAHLGEGLLGRLCDWLQCLPAQPGLDVDQR